MEDSDDLLRPGNFEIRPGRGILDQISNDYIHQYPYTTGEALRSVYLQNGYEVINTQSSGTMYPSAFDTDALREILNTMRTEQQRQQQQSQAQAMMDRASMEYLRAYTEERDRRMIFGTRDMESGRKKEKHMALSRDNVLEEALARVEAHYRSDAFKRDACTVDIDPGVGKSHIAIEYINRHPEVNTVLIMVPSLNLLESWRTQIELWADFEAEIVSTDEERVIDCKHFLEILPTGEVRTVKFVISTIQTMYRKLNLFIGEEYIHTPTESVVGIIGKPDFIIVDEVHTAVTSYYQLVLDLPCTRMLALTGTLDIRATNNKRSVYDKSAPIIYVYHSAEGDRLVNTVNVKIVKNVLGDVQYVGGNRKKRFMTTEKKTYEYWQNRVEQAMMEMSLMGTTNYFRDAASWFWDKTGDEHQQKAAKEYLYSIGRRKEFLLKLNSSVYIARELACTLLDNSDYRGRVMTFSELTSQADKISANSVHSKNDSDINEERLAAYGAGEIRLISTCNSTSMGLNFEHLDYGIVESYLGSPTKTRQRKGRLQRLPTESQATMVFVRNVGTQADAWLRNCISDYDTLEIITDGSELIKSYTERISRQ